jgi:hypothetical protein
MERLEVDRLLDKVAHLGLHSLTEAGTPALEKASSVCAAAEAPGRLRQTARLRDPSRPRRPVSGDRLSGGNEAGSRISRSTMARLPAPLTTKRGPPHATETRRHADPIQAIRPRHRKGQVLLAVGDMAGGEEGSGVAVRAQAEQPQRHTSRPDPDRLATRPDTAVAAASGSSPWTRRMRSSGTPHARTRGPIDPHYSADFPWARGGRR